MQQTKINFQTKYFTEKISKSFLKIIWVLIK